LYVPPPYRPPGRDALVGLARRCAFATVVSATADGRPEATWIPFLIEGTVESPRVYGHMARANRQWRSWTSETPLLAVFQGPHHYISPRWYATSPNVPTWNYLMVQVRGRPRLLDPHADEAEVVDMLHRLVDQFEGGGPEAWQLASQPESFVAELSKGIAAFELLVDDIDGVWKLSQAKEEADRAATIAALDALGGDHATQIATWMRQVGGQCR
jgi:transcriptional regulator